MFMATTTFFKNNRLFAGGTRAEHSLEMFKSHARRIEEYMQDPSIGYERVERVLDAAHTLRFQTYRNVGQKHLSTEAQKAELVRKSMPPVSQYPLFQSAVKPEPPDLNRVPLEIEEDLLLFLYEHAPLEEWERDIIRIVREESLYFCRK